MTSANEAKKLIEKDLKPADILLFSPCKDLESQLIAKLTDSKVSHSAMIYLETNELTEEAPPCATKSPLKERLTDDYKGDVYDRTIHVMRLTDEWKKKHDVKDLDAVLSIATGYMSDEVPYSNYNFYTLGVYMIFRKLIPKDQLSGLTRLLQIATVEIIKFLDKKAYKDVHPFVCSQYVFNCYYTGDEETFKYALQLDPSVLGNSLLRELMTIGDAPVQALRTQNEKLQDMKVRLEKELEAVSSDLLTEVGKLQYANDFIDAINKNSQKQSLALNIQDKDHEAFVKAAHDFFEVFVKAFDLQGIEKTGTPLEKMYAFQEYFVTPNDLFENMSNLEYIGILDNDEIRK